MRAGEEGGGIGSSYLSLKHSMMACEVGGPLCLKFGANCMLGFCRGDTLCLKFGAICMLGRLQRNPLKR